MEVYKIVNDSLYWKNKYAPKNLDDIELDKSLMNNMSNWLKNYNKNKPQLKGSKNIKKIISRI